MGRETFRLIVEWSSVELGHILIKSDNAIGSTFHETAPKKIQVQPVNKSKVRILVKSTCPHLDGLNYFLKSAVLDEYYFIEPHGWCLIRDSHKYLHANGKKPNCLIKINLFLHHDKKPEKRLN